MVSSRPVLQVVGGKDAMLKMTQSRTENRLKRTTNWSNKTLQIYKNASLEGGCEQFNNLWNGMYCYRTKISFEGLSGLEENCLSKDENFLALLIEFKFST